MGEKTIPWNFHDLMAEIDRLRARVAELEKQADETWHGPNGWIELDAKIDDLRDEKVKAAAAWAEIVRSQYWDRERTERLLSPSRPGWLPIKVLHDYFDPVVAPAPNPVKDPDPREWCLHPHGDCPYPDHDCDECPDKPSVDSDVDSDVEGALLHDLSRAEQEIDDTRLVASSDKDITLTVEEGRRFLSIVYKCLKCGGKLAFALDSPRGTCLTCGTVHELGSKIRWEHGRD